MKRHALLLIGLLLALVVRSQTLSFTTNKVTLTQGDSVLFTNTSTGVPGGQVYVWRFGDDCMTSPDPTILDCEQFTTGTGPTITHTYAIDGVYQATLMYQVSPGIFSSTNYSVTITVNRGGTCPAPIPGICTGGTTPENFVINGSFEFDPSVTPNNLNTSGVIIGNRACPWYRPGGNFGTPDVFALNMTPNPNVYAWRNFAGHQVPQHGARYAGIIAATNYNPNGCSVPYTVREYIQAPLTQPLISGRTYIVQFWVSLSDTSGKATPLSVVFSPSSTLTGTQLQQTQNTLCIPATNSNGPIDGQAVNFTTPVAITEKNEWTLIQFEFAPTVSGLQYLTIGYFNDPNTTGMTDILNTPDPLFNARAYYYIDNVKVYENCCMAADYKITGAGTATALTAALGNPVVDRTIYIASGNLSVDVNTTFQGCRFIMGPSTTIDVQANRNLTITDNTLTFNGQNYQQKSYIHAGCNAMWRTINVITANSQLNISNTSINDARIAVSASGTGVYNIINTVFDRNYEGVFLTSGGNYAGTLNGNTFKSSYNILLSPNINQVPQYGVKIVTTTNANIGSPVFNRNNFDGRQQSGTILGLVSGVVVDRSGANILNNIATYCNFGVNMSNSTGVAGLTVSIGNTGASEFNQFTDCYYGVYSTNAFANINIKKNIFDYKTYGLPYRGVELYDPLLSTVNIYYNTFIDYLCGVYISNATVNGTLLTINQNTFDYNLTGPKYLRKGIYVSNVGFSSPSTADAIFDNIVSYQNLSNNFITTGCTPGPFDDCNHHGITLANCSYIRVEDNRVLRSVAPTAAMTSRLNGIRTEASTSITIKENFNRSLGVSVYASGNCNPIYYRCNTGDNCWNQFRYNNATLSTQGAAGNPWDNRWQSIPMGATNKMEGTMSGAGINWYYRNTTNYTVTPIVTVPILITPIVTTGGAGCSAPLARLAENPEATTGDSATKALLLPIADNSIAYQNYPEATRYWALYKAYQMLKGDGTLRDEYDATETALKILYVQLQNSNIGLSDSLSTLAALGDTLGFDALNSSIQPDNNIETLHKTVMGIYAATTMRGKEISADDYTVLEPIALSNPLWDGPAVYSARALLRSDFVNSEDNQNEELRTAKPTVANVLVYPNPSNSQFFISYNLGDEKSALLQVFDINGHFITSAVLATNRGLYTIETNNLENGVYLYSAKGVNGMLASGKLVLIK